MGRSVNNGTTCAQLVISRKGNPVRLPTLNPSRRSGAVLTVFALVLGYFAVSHDGVRTADLRLNDGGVWVTNSALRLVGHLNYPSRTLDGGLASFSDEFDISQEAKDVLVTSARTGGAQSVDTARLVYAVKGEIPQGLVLAHGGPTVAVIDSAGGRLWAMPVADLAHFSPEAEPTLKAAGVRAVVSRDGIVHAVAADGSLHTVRARDGGWVTDNAGSFSSYRLRPSTQLTLVGETLVGFDPEDRRLWTPDRSVTVAQDKLVLQQPGPASDTVALAGPRSVVRISLSADAQEEVDVAEGAAAAPVVVGSCVYAAWSGSGEYRRDCPGTSDDVAKSVPRLARATNLVFRVNRQVVVLNDTADGTVILPNSDFQVVQNWKDIRAQVESQDKGDEKEPDTTEATNATERTKDNHPPVANPDEFGVRPGRATRLPVLLNDTDPDGDILTASVPKRPRFGKIAQVRGGEALQITVGEDSGSQTLTYLVQDGRGGEDRSTVKVSVHPESVNKPPVQQRVGHLVVAAGSTASYNLLPDWIDPDGDDVVLAGVAKADGLQVRQRPDGLVTVRALGGNARTIELDVQVSDGRSDGTTTGVLKVDVRSADKNNPPVANPDHARVAVGGTIVVEPLSNDTDAEGDVLRLISVGSARSGQKISKDLKAGTFTFSGAKPGVTYVDYAVTDGPSKPRRGVVRIDVVEIDDKADPVTDNDLALLPDGGAVLVDVLANDDDPNGGVLVVQSTTVAPHPGLAVEVLDHHLVRVTAPSGLPRSATFEYTVSNGIGSATGQVTVVPLPPVAQPEPPTAKDDPAVVRAGDIVTVHVLDNDSSPSGLDLQVSQDLEIIAGRDLGDFFVSENTVRFKADAKAGRARATYTVKDTRGNFASADVVVSIRGLDEQNSPPQPTPLTARLVGGSQVAILVPTDGIDPNGDSVTLVGVQRPPTMGTVDVDRGKLVFKAPRGAAGTDAFTYTVADRFGAENTGTVQVGIAPPPTQNQLPVAVPDTITARPGVELALPVTANDFDGDGDVVSLLPDSVKPVTGDTTVAAKATGSRIWITTPKDEGVLGYYYDITDGRGGQARGSLTIEVTKTAPLLPPIARDDIVDLADVIGKTTTQVDVLGNDEDPDGVSDRLAVTVDADGVQVAAGKVTVPVKAERQVLVYTVTDKDKLSAKAVFVVPGVGSDKPADEQQPPGPPPTLRQDKLPIRVKAGQRATIALSDYVSVRPGHSPRITFERTVRVGPGGDGSDAVIDERTLAYTSAKDFGGDSSLTFEVTDGASGDDPDGLRAMLTIPIVVEAAKNTPPIFQASPVTVEAGGPQTRVDLRPMVTDPDAADVDKLRFALVRVTGIEAAIDGTTFVASAPLTTEPGATVLAELTVADGTNPPVTAKLPVTVVATTKPLMTARDAEVDAKAGQPTSVDIADYVTNPFASEGKPITIAGRPIVEGDGQLTGVSGTTITVTPGAKFHGQLAVGYVVNDATNRSDRQISGRIRLTVRAAPEPPTAVFAETKASRSATVSWTPGANNGAPITGFTVTWAGGQKECGQVTSCTMNDLQNDRTYSFRVIATNEVGNSEPSAPSPDIRPDVQPDPPGTPTAKFGDQEISLTWPAASTEGSAVTGYTVEISPGGTTQQSAGTSMTWSGLTNGTAYQFRVRATSKAEKPSDWSGYSADEIPAGVPGQPAAPKATPNADKHLPPSAEVSWGAPNGNGDDALTYEVRLAGGAPVSVGTATSHTFNLEVGTTATFEVRATNKAGPSAWSSASNGVRAFQAPGAPTGVTVTPTGQDSQVRIAFTPGALNGALPGEVAYFWSANGVANQPIAAGGATVTHGAAFPNGRDVGVTITAVATVDGVPAASPPSSSATVNAYGPPRAPTVSAEGRVNTVILSWNADASANGRTIVEIRVESSDGAFSSTALRDSREQGNGRNQTKQIRAQVKDSSGMWSDWSGVASAATWSSPWVEIRHDASCQYVNGCRWVDVFVHQFNPGSEVYCFVGSVGKHPDWSRTVRVDGNGNYGWIADSPRLFDTPGSPIDSVPCEQR